MLNSEEALKANLVDEVLPIEEVLPQAEKRMKHFLTADKNIWLNTKTKLRSEWLNKLNDQNEEELEEALGNTQEYKSKVIKDKMDEIESLVKEL